jgi:hypothetical protein
VQTISDDYLKIQQELHKNPKYGVASLLYAPLVKRIFEQSGARSISDYGAGKCNLKTGLEKAGLSGFQYLPYDPAFPAYGPAQQADLVCCIDVLEHIEPEYLSAVLKDLSAITRRVGFFTIATGPAAKILADGRNAHLIQEPTSWWLPKLVEHFEIDHLNRTADHGFWTIVRPR